MRTHRVVIAVAAVAALSGGWYAFRPERLFIDQTVNEPLVGAVPPAQAGRMSAPAVTGTAPAGSMAGSAAAPEAGTAGSAPVAIASGQFHSNAHHTQGDATIYRQAGGSEMLRLTSFQTSNGPDVHVYLVAANDVAADATVKRAGFLELGSLKGNKGDQNYALPANVDLAKYRTVTIWCARFGVNFGSAPLHGAMARTGRTASTGSRMLSAR